MINKVLAGICLGLIIVSVAIIYWEKGNPLVCVESYKIQKILSVHYRSATILLSNGNTHTINQGRLIPGKEYCVKRERKG